MHTTPLLLLLLLPVLAAAAADGAGRWWLRNASATFLDRYRWRHNRTPPPPSPPAPPASSDPVPRPLPPAIQALFDNSIVEVDAVEVLSLARFKRDYFLAKPVLVRPPPAARTAPAFSWTLPHLTALAGDHLANVGTSKAIIHNSGDGEWKTPLREFVDRVIHARPARSGNNSSSSSSSSSNNNNNNDQSLQPLYLFDRRGFLQDNPRLAAELPPTPAWYQKVALGYARKHADRAPATRGLEELLHYFLMTAGDGCGVEPHEHSDGYNTLLSGPGVKLWLLTPPFVHGQGEPPGEYPMYRKFCCGPTSYVHAVLPRVIAESRRRQGPSMRPVFVVQRPGETLYIPELWGHGTIALGDWTVSVAGQLRLGALPSTRTLHEAAVLRGTGGENLRYSSSADDVRRSIDMYKEVHNTFPLLREAAIKSGIGLMELALRQRDEADGGGDRGAREQMLGEAVGIFQGALVYNRHDADIMQLLAEAHFLNGNASAAAALYKQVVRLNPAGVAASLVGLSRAQRMLDGGKVSKSMQYLRAALQKTTRLKEAKLMVLPLLKEMLEQTYNVWKDREARAAAGAGTYRSKRRTQERRRIKQVLTRVMSELEEVQGYQEYADTEQRESTCSKGQCTWEAFHDSVEHEIIQ